MTKKMFFAPFVAAAAMGVSFAQETAQATNTQETREVYVPVLEFKNASLRRPSSLDETASMYGIFLKLNDDSIVHVPIAGDTFVVNGRGDTNKGTEGIMAVRSQKAWSALILPDANYLKNISADKIVEARLNLQVPWVEKINASATFHLYAMKTAWSEDASWAAPTSGAKWKGGAGMTAGADYDAAPLAEVAHAAFKAGTIVFGDISGIVKKWISGEAPQCGLAVQCTGATTQVNIDTRERAGGNPDDILARWSAGNQSTVTFDSKNFALFRPDMEIISSLLIKPDDLMDVTFSVRLVGEKHDTAALNDESAICAYPALTDKEAFRMRAPVAGKDFAATSVAKAKIFDIRSGKYLVLRIPADAIRKNMMSGNKGFILKAEGIGGGFVAFSTDQGRGANAPQTGVNLLARPYENLFTVPVRNKPGVYNKLVGGNFMYGGERLRLWGVTMTPRPNPEMATRLRRIGFNAARLWGPDVNTFYDAASISNGLPKVAVKGDGSRADEFHRLFAEMKKEGMFIDFTSLMDSAPVNTSDGSWLKTVGGGDADWDAWREAWDTKGLHRVVRSFGACFDERIMAARKKHIANVLEFRNPYTGIKYGEEECIALYELDNEQAIYMRLMENGFGGWPEYFLAKYRAKWNAWLIAKYGNIDALKTAWGALDDGESLADNSVKLEPVLASRAKYSAARASDFIEFNCVTIQNHYKHLEAFARSQAPKGNGVNVVPFSYDTQFRPSTQWIHTTATGDIANFGMYFWTLSSALTAPPSMYTMDSHTVKDKATVIYETNVGRPNPFRAEAPLRIAAFAAYQDWDAIFWHFYYGISDANRTVPEEQYIANPIKQPNRGHYWSAVEFETDGLLQSVLSLAGKMFVSGMLAPAKKPVEYVVGRDSLYSFNTFNGINTSRAAFEHGAAFVFEQNKPGGTDIKGVSAESLQGPIIGAVKSGEHTIWDWENGRLIIDAPTVKAYVGKPMGAYKFSDKIAVNFTGKKEDAFICFTLVSADGKPLIESKRAYLSVVDDALNTGFQMNAAHLLRPNGMFTPPNEQANAIVNTGRSPVLYTPVDYELFWPRAWRGAVANYDFAMRKIDETPLASNSLKHKGVPPWMTVLDISALNAAAPTPETTVPPSRGPAATEGDTRAADSTAGTIALWNPLPNANWGDGYFRTHLVLRDGSFLRTSISGEDTSANSAKTITMTEAALFGDSIADLLITFAADKMVSINMNFTRPLALPELIKLLESKYGAPKQQTIAASADKTSTIIWEPADGFRAVITETQGVQAIAFTRK